MFPSPPNFQSGAAMAAWWKARQPDGSWDICATQGRTFVKMLQAKINAQYAHTVWNNPWAITDLHNGAILEDGNWGSLTQQGLAKLAQLKNAPADMMAALERDYRSNTPGAPGNQFSAQSLLAAIWVSQHPDLDLSKIDLDAGAIAPRWDVSPTADGDAADAVTCWNESSVAPSPANAGSSVRGINQNPISSVGLLGSTAGGTSTGILFLAGSVLATAVVVGVLASQSHTRTRYRTRRSKAR